MARLRRARIAVALLKKTFKVSLCDRCAAGGAEHPTSSSLGQVRRPVGQARRPQHGDAPQRVAQRLYLQFTRAVLASHSGLTPAHSGLTKTSEGATTNSWVKLSCRKVESAFGEQARARPGLGAAQARVRPQSFQCGAPVRPRSLPVQRVRRGAGSRTCTSTLHLPAVGWPSAGVYSSSSPASANCGCAAADAAHAPERHATRVVSAPLSSVHTPSTIRRKRALERAREKRRQPQYAGSGAPPEPCAPRRALCPDR